MEDRLEGENVSVLSSFRRLEEGRAEIPSVSESDGRTPPPRFSFSFLPFYVNTQVRTTQNPPTLGGTPRYPRGRLTSR